MAKGDRDIFMNQWGKQRQSAEQKSDVYTNSLFKQLYGYENPGFGGAMNPTQNSLLGMGQTERGNITGGYNNIANNPYGGLPTDVISNLRNIQTPQINSPAYAGYQGLTGYHPQFTLDPGLYQGMQRNIQDLQNIQWNPTDVSTARNAIGGLGGNIAGYQNFADTGGLTAADQANFRARSNAPAAAYYQTQQNELERLGNQAQGNPYAIAATRNQLARQGSQQLSDISQGTESNLTNLLNQYKLAGLTGVQQGLATQAGLANQLAQGQAATQLYGLTGALSGQEQLAQQGLQAQEAAAQLGLQGRLAGLQGMSGIDLANLNAQLAGNQLRSGNEQFLGQQGQAGQLSALSGLTNLYGSDYGPARGMQQLLGNAILGGGGLQNDYLRTLLYGLGGIPSDAQQLFGNITKGVGAGVGALTGLQGLFGGGGSNNTFSRSIPGQPLLGPSAYSPYQFMGWANPPTGFGSPDWYNH